MNYRYDMLAVALKTSSVWNKGPSDALETCDHRLANCGNRCLLRLGISDCHHFRRAAHSTSRAPSRCERIDSFGARLFRRCVRLSAHGAKAENSGVNQLGVDLATDCFRLLCRQRVVPAKIANSSSLPVPALRLGSSGRS